MGSGWDAAQQLRASGQPATRRARGDARVPKGRGARRPTSRLRSSWTSGSAAGPRRRSRDSWRLRSWRGGSGGAAGVREARGTAAVAAPSRAALQCGRKRRCGARPRTCTMDVWRRKDLNSVPLPTVLLLPAWPCALTSVGHRANSGRCRLLHSAAGREGRGAGRRVGWEGVLRSAARGQASMAGLLAAAASAATARLPLSRHLQASSSLVT